MIRDEERREIARRLRGLNGNMRHVRRVYEAEGLSIFCEDQADYYQICDAVAGYLPAEHMHPCDYEELHERLADLIDPECRHEEFCRVCGHVIPNGWGECPRCRSKVVRDDNR